MDRDMDRFACAQDDQFFEESLQAFTLFRQFGKFGNSVNSVHLHPPKSEALLSLKNDGIFRPNFVWKGYYTRICSPTTFSIR